jgi:hypothetical protein
MASGRFSRSLLAVAAAVVVAASLAGCCATCTPCTEGTSCPPFPVDPDPCSTYCLKWVPPVYRDVPRVCQTKPPCIESYEVCTTETKFQEVCTPGTCKNVTVPDTCRMYNVVQVTPAREEWVQVPCRDCAGCEVEDCWRRVRVPPKYDVCPRCETDEGYSYCMTTPPEYSVVAVPCPRRDVRTEYQPAQYDIVYEKQCFTPGHWEWEKRACAECPPACPPGGFCAPPPTATPSCSTCVPAGRRLDRPTWGRCPSAD